MKLNEHVGIITKIPTNITIDIQTLCIIVAEVVEWAISTTPESVSNSLFEEIYVSLSSRIALQEGLCREVA